jgi:hypothetical protein
MNSAPATKYSSVVSDASLLHTFANNFILIFDNYHHFIKHHRCGRRLPKIDHLANKSELQPIALWSICSIIFTGYV